MKQGIYLRAQAADSKDAVIDVVGVIGWDVWYEALRDMLRAIPDTVERVVFDIYSPGGDVWAGNAIIQEIGKLKQKTLARVQVAASMATLIAVACQEREIASNGRWLIHNPWTALMGDAETLEKRAKELRDCETEAAQFYAQRTGKKVEDMIDLMDEERWLTPAEAKELGFVQAINDPFDAAAYATVRAEIEAAGKWPKALAAMPPEPEEPREAQDADDATAGAEGDAAPAAQQPDQPAVPPEVIEAARLAGVAEGIEQAHAEREIIVRQHIDELAKRDALIREHQSARDKAAAQTKEANAQAEAREKELGAQIASVTKSLQQANAQHSKLLGGAMTFEPAPIETWEEAMESCHGNYAEAARKYPKLRDAYNEKHRRK